MNDNAEQFKINQADIDQLGAELNDFALLIRDLKGRVLSAKATGQPEYPALKSELRQLQWQALFYIEIIENLKQET